MSNPNADGRQVLRHRPSHGAPYPGAPFAFWVLLLLVPASAAAAEPDPAANTAIAQRVVVQADRLTYHEAEGRIEGEGRVRVWYGAMTLTARTASADLATRTVRARGDVVLLESEREVRCAALTYDLDTGSALAEGILFASAPWYYQGTRVEKRGDREVLITEPNFTTCDARRPHYHLNASHIDIVLGESLTAYDAVLYVGTTPLFYWPWFRRSLKDGRSPFSIRVGYNDDEGAYVKTKFNYFLLDENYGGLRAEYLQLRGWGFGLDHHFGYAALGKGSGDLSAYYIQDRLSSSERYTLALQDRHELGPSDLVQLNVDYLSDSHFGEDFYAFSTDTYQQKSYLSYSHREAAYYFSAVAQDIETMDPVLRRYYSSLRHLPQVGFSLYPQRVFTLGAPAYLSLNATATRSQVRVDVTGNTVDAAGATLPATAWVNQIHYRYLDQFSLSPGLTQTYAAPLWMLTQPSLSWTLSLPVSGYLKESLVAGTRMDEQDPTARVDASYATSVTLTNKWVNYVKTKPTHLVQSRLSHGFARKFTHLEVPGTPHSGVTSNRLGLGLDYFAGSVFSLQADTACTLLPLAAAAGDWRARLDPLSVNGRATLGDRFQTSWQASYQWLVGKVTSGYLSANTSGQDWTLGAYGSYSYTGVAYGNVKDHAVYGTLSGTYRPSRSASLQGSVQYDLGNERLNQMSLGLGYDLHCWEMQVAWSRYFSVVGDKDEIGFGITLKAFPEVRAGSLGAGALSVGN